MAKRPAKTDGKPKAFKLVSENRQARRKYEILEEFEAGIALQGTEVKSARTGQVNLRESYARVHKGEVYLYNAHISPYSHGNVENHEPMRPRKLLMHRREIIRLLEQTQEKGLTVVPLRMYFKGSHLKVALALCRGRKVHDKRHVLRERQIVREMDRARKRAMLR